MKLLLINFTLYIYINYIKEDWDAYNILGKLFIYPTWIIHSLLIICVSPLILMKYIIIKSKKYTDFKAKLNIFRKTHQNSMSQYRKKW